MQEVGFFLEGRCVGSSCDTSDVPALNQHLEKLPGPPQPGNLEHSPIQRDAMFQERSCGDFLIIDYNQTVVTII